MLIPRIRTETTIVFALVVALEMILTCAAQAQGHDSETFEPIDWPSKPPADCPFEPSEDIVGITFTGRNRAYTQADCWYLSWASDGNMYSPFSDGSVHNLQPDGSIEVIRTLGNRPKIQELWQRDDTDVGYGKVIGDDPMNLTVIGLGALPVRSAPYPERYPSGSLVHDGIWYHGSHAEGEGGLGPFMGFRISRDYGETWTDDPNDPTRPLFGERALDEEGKPNWMPIQIGEPFFVDFGKNMEHSPDGKAYLVAHGATERHGRPRLQTSAWGLGDEAYLLRVTPSPETMNDASAYEFLAGFDEEGRALWTSERSEMKPLLDWRGKIGPTSITYNPHLKKYLCCVTDGRDLHGRYDTFLLESDALTGPWKLIVYMEHFGEQAYFVNFPSKFISADGRTAWLCYSANFSKGGLNPDLEPSPPGSRYGMTLQEIRLRAK